MTEAQWLASTDPAAMLAAPEGRVSDAQLRGWVEACREEEENIAGRKLYWQPINAASASVWMHLKGDSQSPTIPARAALLRDVIGNPFREFKHWYRTVAHKDGTYENNVPTIEPALAEWRDGLLPAMAADLRERRAWGEMPVLADALVDAGVPEGSELVMHCRGYERCPACLGDGTDLLRRANVKLELGLKCATCHGQGWRLGVVHCVGCWVLKLLTGR